MRSSMYGSNIIARIYRDIQGTKINVPNHTKATNALLKQHQRRYNYSYQMMEKNWMMYPLFPVRIYKQCHKKSCISTEDVEALNNFVKKRTEWILNRAWCLLFETARYHSWDPPPPPPYPLLKDGGGGGRTFQKLSHLRGYQKFCQKEGITLKRGGGWCRKGGFATFWLLDSSIVFTVYVGGGVKFLLLHFGASAFWVNHARFSSKSF